MGNTPENPPLVELFPYIVQFDMEFLRQISWLVRCLVPLDDPTGCILDKGNDFIALLRRRHVRLYLIKGLGGVHPGGKQHPIDILDMMDGSIVKPTTAQAD